MNIDKEINFLYLRFFWSLVIIYPVLPYIKIPQVKTLVTSTLLDNVLSDMK